MCYDDNAMPPTPPGAGETALGEDIILTAAEQNRFAAFVAHPASPKNVQVLIYPDVRGLHKFYKELALRFAEVGITAMAIDYFGRTAGIGSRDEPFDYMPHVQQIHLASFFSDVTAALAHLRSGEDVQRSTFTIGFCMGGTLSFLTGTRQEYDLAGVIGFYSGMSRKFEGARGTLLDEARHIVYPALGLFGGDDSSIPVDKIRAFDEELDRAGVEHEVIIYPGAPHSFFDKRATEFAEASADAWQRVLGFISAHTKEK